MWPFVKSVIYGSLAGAAPMLWVLILFSVGLQSYGVDGGSDWRLLLLFAAVLLIVSTVLVLGATLFIGLPLTWILSRKKRESAAAYIGAGIAFGLAIPILMFVLSRGGEPDSYWLALFGALGGGVAGRTWWVSAREPKIDYSL